MEKIFINLCFFFLQLSAELNISFDLLIGLAS